MTRQLSEEWMKGVMGCYSPPIWGCNSEVACPGHTENSACHPKPWNEQVCLGSCSSLWVDVSTDQKRLTPTSLDFP